MLDDEIMLARKLDANPYQHGKGFQEYFKYRPIQLCYCQYCIVNLHFADVCADVFTYHKNHALQLTSHVGLIQTYANTTARVCRHLCVTLHSLTCCALTFDRLLSACYILSLTASCQDQGLAHLADNNPVSITLNGKFAKVKQPTVFK
jgi:hypothetical protein